MGDWMRWATHGIQQRRVELSQRMAVTLFTAAVALTLVAVLYLMLVSSTAARGRHIQQLQGELARIQRENEQLEVEIARASAVSRLWQRAVELGFVPAEQIEFIPMFDGSAE